MYLPVKLGLHSFLPLLLVLLKNDLLFLINYVNIVVVDGAALLLDLLFQLPELLSMLPRLEFIFVLLVEVAERILRAIVILVNLLQYIVPVFNF